MSRLRKTRCWAVLLGSGYAIWAFIVGIQPEHNQILFDVIVFMSAISFNFGLDCHERMNDLRRRDDNR